MTQRADVLLVQNGLAQSRQQAQGLIMAGRVYVDEVMVRKASEALSPGANLSVRGEQNAYASRGAHKLLKALDFFRADVTDMVCLDIGAAAGGFTDVLLRAGARHVYAVDVGYGQLDWRLRQDERVTVMERTNARLLTAEQFDAMPALTVMDVSFISIKLILPAAAAIMGVDGRFLTLVKPQFEAGRGQVGKHGVVREADTHARVLREVRDFCPGMGWSVHGFTHSPITGPKGNMEFLADIRPGAAGTVSDADIDAAVTAAHDELKQ